MSKTVDAPVIDSAISPMLLEQWFSPERQAHYVRQIRKQADVTRWQAECFIRLWAYLMLKHISLEGASRRSLQDPLEQLTPMSESVPCSHREAADLFYAHKDRGSDRAAGLMIDRLAKQRLLCREFDGNISTIHIRPMANINHGPDPARSLNNPIVARSEQFDPRRDAVFSAQMLARYYGWISTDTTAIAGKFSQALRQWSNRYPTGMRVLRTEQPGRVVGMYSLFPTTAESSMYFFAPPSQSLYLITDQATDTLTMAQAGDPNVSAVYIRGWAIDEPYFSPALVQQSLRDMQNTLRRMQQDFPNLCDVYGLSMHPGSEAIAQAVGFQKTVQDPNLPVAWMYIPLDQFLAVDIETAVATVQPLMPVQ